VLIKGQVFPKPFSDLELSALPAQSAYTCLQQKRLALKLKCHLQVMKNLFLSLSLIFCVDLLYQVQFWHTNVVLPPQQASYHPDVSEEVRERALRFGTECTLGYLELLEHVLLVRRSLHAHTGSILRRKISLTSFYSGC